MPIPNDRQGAEVVKCRSRPDGADRFLQQPSADHMGDLNVDQMRSMEFLRRGE